IGAQVVTREGQGKVISQEILSRQVVIAYEDRRRVTTPLTEIVSVLKTKPQPKGNKPKDADEEE
ncbi:MAG: signal peptidase, partial [Planctomycetaceae bacterium]|nr:signal peptidase [Planctomycetaceae bacterium]